MRTQSLKAFFENPIFLASITSWFFAQLIKAMIVLLSSHKKGARDVFLALAWRTGGMPSSHAALVAAMTTSAAFTEGVGSNVFIVSFWLALIVMRDALGVRRSSGLQARSLNMLGKAVAEKLDIEFKPVKEIHGHKPLEVAVGALLGVFIAAAYAFL
ncbi:MAG: divergent PAP2 family protein [Treponema sp.]|jgi:acid phosphatase family membrane protein YuiD|nr:divergent PAP2 family protein [Treponema sp.]